MSPPRGGGARLGSEKVVPMFEAALHDGVGRAQEGLQRARYEGLPQEESRHAARLLDLMDRARRSGIDTTGWVHPAVMAAALSCAGDL